MALRPLLHGLGALLHEGIDGGLGHFPAPADLHRFQLAGVHQVPGGGVVHAQHRRRLAQVVEERCHCSHVRAFLAARSRVSWICCFAAGVRSKIARSLEASSSQSSPRAPRARGVGGMGALRGGSGAQGVQVGHQPALAVQAHAVHAGVHRLCGHVHGLAME